MFEYVKRLKADFVNDKLIGRTLEVTEKDIRLGTCEMPDACALALSAKREMKTNIVSVGYSSIGFAFQRDSHDVPVDMISLNGKLTERVTDWIDKFDNKSYVEPITLEIKPNTGQFDFIIDIKE